MRRFRVRRTSRSERHASPHVDAVHGGGAAHRRRVARSGRWPRRPVAQAVIFSQRRASTNRPRCLGLPVATITSKPCSVAIWACAARRISQSSSLVVRSRVARFPSLSPQRRRPPPGRSRHGQKPGVTSELVESIKPSATPIQEQAAPYLKIGSLWHRHLNPGRDQFLQPRFATSRLVIPLGVGHHSQGSGVQQNQAAHADGFRDDGMWRAPRASRRRASVSRCSCSSPSFSQESSSSASSRLLWSSSSSLSSGTRGVSLVGLVVGWTVAMAESSPESFGLRIDLSVASILPRTRPSERDARPHVDAVHGSGVAHRGARDRADEGLHDRAVDRVLEVVGVGEREFERLRHVV
jgi:hypothetical protein